MTQVENSRLAGAGERAPMLSRGWDPRVRILARLLEGLRYGSLPAHEMSMTLPHAGLFLAGVALLVIDLLSFGPFVSDYTRYLPADTSGPRLFWAIYAGNVLATFLSCAVGAYLTALLPSLGPVAAIGKTSGSWALVIMALSLVNGVTINAYTGIPLGFVGGPAGQPTATVTYVVTRVSLADIAAGKF